MFGAEIGPHEIHFSIFHFVPQIHFFPHFNLKECKFGSACFSHELWTTNGLCSYLHVSNWQDVDRTSKSLLLVHSCVTSMFCPHISGHLGLCCQNHLVTNCFSYILLSFKQPSQKTRDDSSLSEASSQNFCLLLFLFHLVKNVWRKSLQSLFYCPRLLNWFIKCFPFYTVYFIVKSTVDSVTLL